MKDFLDRMQQAWQSQCAKPGDFNPDQLLWAARLERRAYLWTDILIISFFSSLGIWWTWSAFNEGIHEDWPRLITVACLAWVVGFILFNRWRRRRDASHFDESLLGHVEQSIKDIEHQMWLDRYNLWWYILPITLGCMIPPVIFFVMEYGERPLMDSLIPLLFGEVTFAITFLFVYWVMGFGGKLGREGQRKELEAFRELRETLLNEGESK